ncbi:MAG: hypothetical protein IKQ77_05500 [Prevotella sp.]|nr:hypothetical protein [Prevotella sp.]
MMEKYNKEMSLLDETRRMWDAMSTFRKERERCKRYCYGDQWGDLIWVDGQWMREDNYIRSQGSEPLKNNLIRRLVKQVLGLYRSENTSIKVLTDDKWVAERLEKALEDTGRTNACDEVNARAMEEFLVSGLTVQRKTFGMRNGIGNCWTDNVPPDHFLIDAAMGDSRGWGVSMVGELHDLNFDTLCAEFARSAEDVKHLAEIYKADDYKHRVQAMQADFGMSSLVPADFFLPCDRHLCRVYEIWRKVRKPGYLCHNKTTGTIRWMPAKEAEQWLTQPNVVMRWQMEEEWRYLFLSPFGDVIDEGSSPYRHGGHPYVFKGYPLVDGEIHSFVSDVIDQQRYTNRLITLYDWVMRSSAKGVLLVPEESLCEGYTIDDVADEWARFNGVIPVRTRNGTALPQQVAANAVNIGINELLQTQLNFMEDISGVTGALQGKTGNAGVSGTLYEQQTRNATLSQLDLLDTFRNFLLEGARKDISNIQQFYTDKMLACNSTEQLALLRNAHFDLEWRKQ